MNPTTTSKHNTRLQKRWFDTASGMILSAVVACVALVPFPTLAAPPEATNAVAEAEAEQKSVPAENIELAKIRRFSPTENGLNGDDRRRLLEERKLTSFSEHKRRVLPDGKIETMERHYWRTHPYPDIRLESGTTVVHGVGLPPGAVSVSGTRPLFNEIGDSSGKEERIWQWNVPPALRDSSMMMPSHRENYEYEHFKPVLLQNKSIQRLLLFDATKGLVWSKDIQGYTTEASESEPASGEKVVKEKSPNPFVVIGIACSFDGAYTLVLLSPQEITPETGMRLMVFDKKGKLISQTQLMGVRAYALRQNGSGNSHLVSTTVLFEDGKTFTGKPTSASTR